MSDDGEKARNGEIGEICFKGPGIIKCYINRSQLTRNAFVKIDGATYFRTGDLGRMHTSGNLEYLGRRDFQIKLRGQRIELVEIESHLRQASGVRDVVVTATKIGASDKRLIAYITLEDPSSFSLDAIRGYLHNQLPDYMQPSGWIILDSMPLNENFKIARKALPAASLKNLIVTETYVAPRNETERVLTKIWQNILDIPLVGINDNFFNLGGDSLIAMNACMLAAEKGIKISPLQMANTPTIAGLIEAVVGQYLELDSCFPNDRSSGSLPELPPLILRFLYERGSQTPHRWNISRILVAKRRLSFELVEKTFRYLGERHDALRLRFERDVDRWQARVLKTSKETLACRTVDLSNLPKTKQNEAIAEVAKVCQREVNLTNGPLACMVLFELGKDNPQEMFFVVHHFAMDVISWKIFWLEFDLVYQQLEKRSDETLSTSPISFKTWTQVLQQCADSLAVEADVQKWVRQSWSEVSALPKDLSGESNLNTNGSAQVVRFTLSEGETQALMRSGAHGLVFERILISGLAVALGQWQESGVVYFDRLVHGRNVGSSQFDLSQTIGCIISYAPTLLRIDTRASVANILLEVSEQMEQVRESGTSIDLYRYLGTKSALTKRLEELPRAEVLLNYRGKVDDVLDRSSVFDRIYEIADLDHNPEGLRQYPLALVIDIIDHKLEVRCVFSTNMHKRESITALCAEFLNFLKLVINRPLRRFPKASSNSP